MNSVRDYVTVNYFFRTNTLSGGGGTRWEERKKLHATQIETPFSIGYSSRKVERKKLRKKGSKSITLALATPKVK